MAIKAEGFKIGEALAAKGEVVAMMDLKLMACAATFAPEMNIS